MKLLYLLIVLLLAPAMTQADSLFTQADEASGTLVAEKVNRFEPGDIVTVLVREEIEATVTANTDTKKESDVDSLSDAADNSFLVDQDGLNLIRPEQLPNWNVEAENETKTQGTTRRSSTLTTTITCIVTEVFPNGQVRLEGERTVSINREDSVLMVAGLVRAKDVEPDNTVPSTKMAGVKLELKGKGPLWNNQRRGLVTRFLDWFSPF